MTATKSVITPAKEYSLLNVKGEVSSFLTTCNSSCYALSSSYDIPNNISFNYDKSTAVMTINSDGTISGDPWQVKETRGYAGIINLAKKFMEQEKKLNQLQKEYNDLSDVAIAMDNALMKLKAQDDAKIKDVVPKPIEKAIQAINKIGQNGMHASWESIVENGEKP